jgi:hypothetical protein
MGFLPYVVCAIDSASLAWLWQWPLIDPGFNPVNLQISLQKCGRFVRQERPLTTDLDVFVHCPVSPCAMPKSAHQAVPSESKHNAGRRPAVPLVGESPGAKEQPISLGEARESLSITARPH